MERSREHSVVGKNFSTLACLELVERLEVTVFRELLAE